MGTVAGNRLSKGNENAPQRQATLSNFIAATNYPPSFYQETLSFNSLSAPAVGAIWHNSVAFCDWISTETDLSFRLPAEIEWEEATRGTDERKYAWGNQGENSNANLAE